MANWLYYPEFTGAALQSRRLARELYQLGAQIEVLTGTSSPDLVGTGILDGFKVHRFLTSRSSTGQKLLLLAKITRFLVKNRRNFDIVHTHGFIPQVSLPAKWLGLPVVQKITCEQVDDPDTIRRRFLGEIGLHVYRQADVIVAPSPRLYQMATAALPETARIRKISNGVDTSRFSPVAEPIRQMYREQLDLAHDEIVLLSVATLSYSKGADLLLDALPLVMARTTQKLKILLVGPQSRTLYYRDPRTDVQDFFQVLKKKVHDLGLSACVRFEGRKENIPAYMRAADILVHPARQEGQPNVILEALASGLPVVTHLIPGVTDDLVDHTLTGYVIDARNAEAFANYLLTLVENADVRLQMGERARTTVLAKYELQKIAIRYLALYRSLLPPESNDSFRIRPCPEPVVRKFFSGENCLSFVF